MLGWTIGGGVATDVAGTASVLSQAFAPAALSVVQVDFTVTRTARTISPRLTGGTTVTGASYAANGADRHILIAASGNTALEFSADAAFAATIDNVSVKILTPGA